MNYEPTWYGPEDPGRDYELRKAEAEARELGPLPDTPEPAYWTIAYRKRHANRFQRVTNWCGTWQEACVMANRFGADNPDLQVWFTPTREAELTKYVPREDVGNILTDNDKRVLITDNGTLPDIYL